LTFVAYKWRQPGLRTVYTAEHVNRWAHQVRLGYRGPARFVCITDDGEGIQPGIDVVPLWDDCAELANPNGVKFPNCHRRLRMWGSDAHDLIHAEYGARVVLMDLDCTVVGDLTPLFDRPEDVVLWRDPGHNQGQPYNGGFIMLRLGSRPHVWDAFAGAESIRRAATLGYRGSDQAWLALALGHGEATWTPADGVLSYRRDAARGVPEHARIIMHHGLPKPWDVELVFNEPQPAVGTDR
jgi:hypothetical protein